MVIVFRADASLQAGSGHVMRCLSLADALHNEIGAQCHFICRAHPGHLANTIRARGYRITLLPPPDVSGLAKNFTNPQPAHAAWLGVGWEVDSTQTLAALKNEPVADWLVVDHYALDAGWERCVRIACRHLMAIDDLADRPHDCDLLLDQNLGRPAADYTDRVSSVCRIFTGSQYALLRSEFALLRPASLARRERVTDVQSLMISLGGVDNDNVTCDVLAALEPNDLPDSCRITIVMGVNSPWLMAVQDQAALMRWPTRVLVNAQNMAQLMLESDLAIGAAGTTSWERCCMGLPAVIIVLAENQRRGAMALTQAGAVVAINSKSLLSLSFRQSLRHARSSLQILSRRASSLCGGQGSNFFADYLRNGFDA